MTMMPSFWTRTLLVMTLLVWALPLQGWTYNILLVPFIAKSHVFSLASIAEGLVDRGHRVTFLIGENYRLHVPELRNRTEFSVMRFRDTTTDYDAVAEECSRAAIESGSNLKQLVSIATIMKGVYVNFFYRATHTQSSA